MERDEGRERLDARLAVGAEVVDIKMLWWAGAAAVTLVTGGWAAHETIATKQDVADVDERVMIAASQAQFALDQQIEDVAAKIARLEAKPNKTAADIENLRYWRGVLQRLRRIRAGTK